VAGMEGGNTLALAAISLLLMLVMLGASWIPARRAMRIEPMEALRDL